MVERTEARLDEVSAVSFPAYDGALIAGVRTAATDLSDLIAALIDDPEALALLARSLPVLSSSAPDAADPGTSESAPAAPDLEPLTHSGLSADARSRVLALLS